VSCFGKDDASDTGDNWRLQCPEEYWEKDSAFELLHVDTNQYLASDLRFIFNNQNCRDCPIIGQLEAYAQNSPSAQTKFALAFDDDPSAQRTIFLKWSPIAT
jgi:hypothetical protein